MKKLLSYLIILVIIGAVVVGGMKIIKAKRATEAKISKPIAYSMNVKTMTPKSVKTTLTLPYLAITKSNDDVKISSRVSGRILHIAKSGERVNKGDTIVKIDDKELKTELETLKINTSSLKSQIKSKEVALENLKKTHERTQKLLSVKGASKEQFEREITNIEAAKTGINTLKLKIRELKSNKSSINNMLSYTTIKSPVSGVITRLANVGDNAMMGKPLISISGTSNSYLVVRLPQDIVAKAIIYDKKKYEISPLNTTYNGLLEYLANIDKSLTSNQTINIDVVVYDGVGFNLPHDALLNRNGKYYVLDLINDRAKPKEVKIVANGEQGVVVEGVSNSDKVVVAKQDILLKLLSGIKARAIK
ncbi:MAG: biotin/lipoyl-binding protein [Epsilonproteobacteria bacterium]|nr:biotin/lipoyl-binding protein [Campylobacterota bacterium]